MKSWVVVALMVPLGLSLGYGYRALTDKDPESKHPAPHYGVSAAAFADEVGCTAFTVSNNQFKGLDRGSCRIDGETFEVITFADPAKESSHLLVNTLMDSSLYYVYVPGAVLQSAKATQTNWDDKSVYEPIRDAAYQLADPVEGEVYTSKQMMDRVAGELS